jgi:hypothetical protein
MLVTFTKFSMRKNAGDFYKVHIGGSIDDSKPMGQFDEVSHGLKIWPAHYCAYRPIGTHVIMQPKELAQIITT